MPHLINFRISSNINVLNYNHHGWFALANQIKLEEFIKNYNPKIIVELGSWLGSSAIFMGEKSSDTCKIYAIDTWLGSLEHHVITELKEKLPTLFHQFLSNVIHKNMTHKIIPFRMSSMEAVEIININNIDLLYIDASHDEIDVYNDIVKWWSKVDDNGIMCGDDFLWSSVKNAIEKAMQDLNINKIYFHTFGNFWWFDTKNIIYSNF